MLLKGRNVGFLLKANQICNQHGLMQQTRNVPGGDFSRILSCLKYKLEFADNNKAEAMVLLPGFAYSDYDNEGKPSLSALMKLMEGARIFAHHSVIGKDKETFRDYAKLTSDRLMFIVTSEMKCFPSLYDLDVPKTPVIALIKGGYVGKSSLNTVTHLMTADGGNVLAENTNQLVSVSKESRRPLELPVWWRRKYDFANADVKPLVFGKHEVPALYDIFTDSVQWSDTDFNRHANWTVYARMAKDALHLSDLDTDSKLSNARRNLKSNISKAQFYFYGESLLRDKVKTCLWDDQMVENVVYYDYSVSGKSIGQCKFVFH